MPCKPTYEELEQKIKNIEKAESERKREVDALRDQLLHQTTLMDASLDGIAIIDQTHRVRQANKRFAQMLGYTPEEVLGLHTWDWEANMTEAEIRANLFLTWNEDRNSSARPDAKSRASNSLGVNKSKSSDKRCPA